VTAFNTDYRDFIETKARIGVDADTGTLLFQSRNIDKASVYGFEFDYEWAINNQWSTSTSLAWTKGKNELSNQELDSISPSKAVFNVNWNSLNDKWNAKMFTTFSDSKKGTDDNLISTPSYATVDFLIQHKLNNKSDIRLGMFNLFNEKYWNWQQVRHFDSNDQIINSLSQPSNNISISYSIEL
jgi:hemoglobin/transferrin/lactoferrin receptor protein